MATYYRWRKSTVEYTPYVKDESTSELAARFRYTGAILDQTFTIYYGDSLTVEAPGLMALSGNVGSVTLTRSGRGKYLTDLGVPSGEKYIAFNQSENIGDIDLIYERGTNVCLCNTEVTKVSFSGSSSQVADIRLSIDYQLGQTVKNYGIKVRRGTFVDYVYSTRSVYPNGGVSDGYYYDQRTTITSPTAPTNIQYPNPITTPTVTVSWNGAVSNVPGVSIDHYVLFYGYNNLTWNITNISVDGTSAIIQIPATYAGNPVTSIQFYLYAVDANGQTGSTLTTAWIPVLFAPTLTVPSLAMQNQPITVNWTAITGATSYTLQRKANTDADWTQVYSGANLSYSETVGTWTTVQYRVQAVFSGTPGGWAESAAIPVVSSSALVISGTDGDLGTVVNDIPYSISTDTGNQITATITVNSAVIFSGNVGNSTSDIIPVLDLVNGEGTIVIEASVTSGSAPVSAVRTWTYTKAPITFPNAGSVAQLTQEGKNIFPKTLAECVRLPGGKTLDEVTAFPAQVYAGSYVGTGTHGQSNPNHLTFPFKPKAVFIQKYSTGITGHITRLTFIGDGNGFMDTTMRTASPVNTVQFSNTVSWYGIAASDQMNESGETYNYVAIG